MCRKAGTTQGEHAARHVWKFEKGKPLYDVSDFSNFKDDVIESICYIPVKWFENAEDMKNYNLNTEDLVILMRDILGEAG